MSIASGQNIKNWMRRRFKVKPNLLLAASLMLIIPFVPFTGRHGSLFLYQLLFSSSLKFWNSCAFAVCLVIAIFALTIPSPKSLILSALALYLGFIALAKPYSGFDETAHVDMMNRQFRDEPYDERPEFWKRVDADMLAARFPQLHGGIAPLPGVCPHAILGSCGYTNGPQKLYRFYYELTRPFFGSDFSLQRDYPWHLRKIAIFFNGLWVVLLLLLARFFVGSPSFPIVAAILILYGGVLSQFATITNDIPMATYGVLLSVMACAPFVRPARIRDLAGFLMLCSGWWCLLRVDRSSLSALPLLVSFPPLWYLAVRSRRSTYQKSNQDRSLILSVFICGLTVLCTGLAVRWLVLANPFGLLSFLYEKLPDTAMIQNVGLFTDFGTALQYLGQYYRSFFGSFVWGHSYYHGGGYIFLGALYAYFLCQGIRQIHGLPNQTFFPVLVLLSSLFAVHFAIVLAVATSVAGFSDIEIIRDSFLKTRLTAPGTASILTLLFLGLFHARNFSRGSLWLIQAWALVLLAYYGPQFYLIDAL